MKCLWKAYKFNKVAGALFTGVSLTVLPLISAFCQERVNDPSFLAPYLPSPTEIVRKMLRLADVKPTDVVYDIGCGDGRIVITAAKEFGAKGVGIEIDPILVTEALENAQEEGVRDKVTILEQDALKADLSPATVVTIYLLPFGILKLKPMLEKYLKPGVRVVFHTFEMEGWKSSKVDYYSDYNGFGHLLYLCVIGKQK